MAPTATPAASLANEQDPYAKYGGSASADPYAKYGGAAITQPPAQNQSVKAITTFRCDGGDGERNNSGRRVGFRESRSSFARYEDRPESDGRSGGWRTRSRDFAPEAGWLGHAALTGLGSGVGTAAGQAVTGENPVSRQSLEESGTNTALFGLSDLLFGAPPALASTKLGRSFVNESVGATGRDVIYGNPAKALTDERIHPHSPETLKRSRQRPAT